MLPATNSEATLVKNWNVSGSMGALTMRGSMSSPNSRIAGVRRRRRGRIGNRARTMPANRIRRWSSAPITAPTAAPKIPSAGLRSTVPATMPPL
jgi:hypothetical protein